MPHEMKANTKPVAKSKPDWDPKGQHAHLGAFTTNDVELKETKM